MSDINFAFGGIGSGKTLWATIQIAEELDKSDREIVTNIDLNLEDIAEYCREHIARPIDVTKRIRVLTEQETKSWWLFVVGIDYINCADVFKSRAPGCPQYRGVLYLLDEVHITFSARNWVKLMNPQSPSFEVETYMSQLRKLNDDLWLISQHPEKVDKNFRRNATRWFKVKNLGKNPLLLGVGFPGRFRWSMWTEEPKRGDKPEQSGWYRLKNRGYHKLYNTMSGVGVKGLHGVAEDKPSIGHWWRWAAALGVLLVGAYFLPALFRTSTTAAIGGLSGGLTKEMTKSLPSLTTPAAAVAGVVRGSGVSEPKGMPSVPPTKILPLHSVTNEVFVNGHARIPGKGYVITLTDGRVFRSWQYDDSLPILYIAGRGLSVGDKFYRQKNGL